MWSRTLAVVLLPVCALVGQELALPEFVLIPAGEFEMGSAEGAAWERPTHTVWTPAMELSARPISNREFLAFRPDHRSPGDNSPEAPVTGVSWTDAEAYAQWLQEQLGVGIALPTEARWEHAVRGGLEQQTYPWGNDFDPAASANPGSRANGYGVVAVSYNLWEWTSDWYAPDYYAKSQKEDPAGPDSGDFRVLRGGGFRSDPSSATCYSRGSARPGTSSAYVTFRVMKTGEQPPQQLTQTAPPPAPPQPADVAAARPPAPAAAGLRVTALDFESSSTGLEIRLSVTGQPSHRAFPLAAPDRLVVDLEGAEQRITRGSGTLPVGRSGVRQIRYSQFQLDPPITRIVVDLDGPVTHRVEAGDAQVLIRLDGRN